MNHNLLRISSDFKTANSESNSNYQVAYNNIALLQGITRCVMKSADIPNVFYNISDKGYNFDNTGNNVFYWTNGMGVDKMRTIPPGQYTVASLLAYINVHIQVDYPPLYTVKLVQDPVSMKVYVDNLSSLPFGIYYDGCTVMPYLGFSAALPVNSVAMRYAAGLPNLAGIQEVYVTSQKISDCSNMVVAANTMFPVILNIQIDQPFGSFVHYASQHPEIDDIEYPSLTQGTNLQLVDIQLRDRWGHILDLQGMPFNLIVKCYHGSP